MNKILRFSLKLLLAMGLVFGIHLYILNSNNAPLFDHQIVEAYIVNYILAIIIYATLYNLRIKHEHILGFVFMAGSLLKFAVFFIFFYPNYKEDGLILKLETTAFLVPYISSLFLETYFLIKLLNKKY